MQHDELPEWSKKAAEWAADYHATLRERPVRSQSAPGEISRQIAKSPPDSADSMEAIFADFQNIIPDGMTHWQHPRFFAYFSSNAAPASMLAEQLANAISAQCMLWQTSPAAAELETVMMDWLRQALDLPQVFRGVIHDSATTATLCAVLTMREHALKWRGLTERLAGHPPLRIYASAQTHCSVDKAARLAGIGQGNLIKVDTDDDWAMRPDALRQAIQNDRAAGMLPIGIIGCIGGTSFGASDRLRAILNISKDENMYSHVDAAWAGSAMICPEHRHIWDGIELADSLVVNPHKWLGASFDCSVQFLRDPAAQVQTLSLRPDYLKTQEEDEITNYSDWTIPLGRRFRALKIWFLLRAHGLDDLRNRIRNHIAWTQLACDALETTPGIEIMTRPKFALFTFRLAPHDGDADESTRELLQQINADGRIYLTQTSHQGMFVIRLTVGQFDTTRDDVEMAVRVIREIAARVTKQN
ncbi:MAG: pyridoxal-dependent decarboxylase [Pirellulaceae bacterium]|nr:pyridoxal-dependent decarboxylase [Pirellulaceae bacterium]